MGAKLVRAQQSLALEKRAAVLTWQSQSTSFSAKE